MVAAHSPYSSNHFIPVLPLRIPVIVIGPSCGLKGRREGGGDPCRRHEYKLHTNGDAGQGGRGSSTESMEGTRARRAVPSRATERRVWGGAVDPCGRSTHGRSCSLAGDEVAAQRRTFEVDAVVHGGRCDRGLRRRGSDRRSPHAYKLHTNGDA